MGQQISLVGINQEEGSFTSARIGKKIPVRRPAFHSNQSSLCSLPGGRYPEGEGPDGKTFSMK